jgi:hypothetical protein
MNSPDITIEDVDLQKEKSSGYIEGKVRVIIALKNNSKTSTYYVLKRPRTIEYDRGSHTLSISLYEKDLLQGVKVSSGPVEPEQIAILPDSTFQWQYLIPVWIKKITRPAGSREIIEVLDISAVQKVVCTVAYHTSPLRDKWVETVSAGFERTLNNH